MIGWLCARLLYVFLLLFLKTKTKKKKKKKKQFWSALDMLFYTDKIKIQRRFMPKLIQRFSTNLKPNSSKKRKYHREEKNTKPTNQNQFCCFKKSNVLFFVCVLSFQMIQLHQTMIAKLLSFWYYNRSIFFPGFSFNRHSCIQSSSIYLIKKRTTTTISRGNYVKQQKNNQEQGIFHQAKSKSKSKIQENPETTRICTKTQTSTYHTLANK